MGSLAWKNLVSDRGRFFVALAGIMFSVALVAIQNGVFAGFVRSAGLLIDESTADIWVSAQEMRYVELTLPLPYDDVRKALAVAGVERAEPMVVRTSVFKGPNHRIELIRVVGLDPDGTLFRPGPVSDADLRKLRDKNTILVDRANLAGLNLQGVGDTGVIGPSTVRVAALTQGTQPIVSATFIYASLENQRIYLSQLAPTGSLPTITNPFNGLTLPLVFEPAGSEGRGLGANDLINYVLVKAKPGTDIPSLQTRLEAALPGTRTYSRQAMADVTRDYWRQRTGLGFVLALGALVGIIVGMAVVGQILYTSVSEHIREYGTLKAMGASDWELYKIIATQSVIMAVLGFVPGIVLSVWVAAYAMTHRGTLILITPGSAVIVFAITVAMCVASAIFAMQRVVRIDPAVVFKA